MSENVDFTVTMQGFDSEHVVAIRDLFETPPFSVEESGGSDTDLLVEGVFYANWDNDPEDAFAVIAQRAFELNGSPFHFEVDVRYVERTPSDTWIFGGEDEGDAN